MPLPKLPNRPAAILTFPSGDTARAKAARTNSKPAVALRQDAPAGGRRRRRRGRCGQRRYLLRRKLLGKQG
ncbi:hypothetical protein, partial [Bordetella pertussis]|uniref:hypothetical protein n=1 Tax=Bordetella pertussis TaxID=520 RepID=UPI0036706F7A